MMNLLVMANFDSATRCTSHRQKNAKLLDIDIDYFICNSVLRGTLTISIKPLPTDGLPIAGLRLELDIAHLDSHASLAPLHASCLPNP